MHIKILIRFCSFLGCSVKSLLFNPFKNAQNFYIRDLRVTLLGPIRPTCTHRTQVFWRNPLPITLRGAVSTRRSRQSCPETKQPQPAAVQLRSRSTEPEPVGSRHDASAQHSRAQRQPHAIATADSSARAAPGRAGRALMKVSAPGPGCCTRYVGSENSLMPGKILLEVFAFLLHTPSKA